MELRIIRDDGTMEVTCAYCGGCGVWEDCEEGMRFATVICPECQGEGYVLDTGSRGSRDYEVRT